MGGAATCGQLRFTRISLEELKGTDPNQRRNHFSSVTLASQRFVQRTPLDTAVPNAKFPLRAMAGPMFLPEPAKWLDCMDFDHSQNGCVKKTRTPVSFASKSSWKGHPCEQHNPKCAHWHLRMNLGDDCVQTLKVPRPGAHCRERDAGSQKTCLSLCPQLKKTKSSILVQIELNL